MFIKEDKLFATTWNVGSTQIYTLPSQISTLVQNGDTIYIDGGVYVNDATKWTKNNLKIIGLGTGNNRSILQFNVNIPNRKGIFLFENSGISDNAYIENIVFDGAQISDADGANGAGIRFQSANLIVDNCKFINCQNGILEGNAGVNSSTVVIINSEFENNGYQLPNDPTHSGFEHHIYISASTDSLLVRNCYFHQPRGQANSIKTRAQSSYILYNFIDEESTGYGSWEINIAQGGLNVIVGNVIIQGSSGANHGIVGYDAVTNALEDFYFINNTVINKYSGNIKFFNVVPSSGINTFKVYNNIFASVPGANNTLITGNIPGVLDTSNNTYETDYLNIAFTDPLLGDYSLTSGSTSVIDNGVNPGITSTGYSLSPVNMYQSFTLALLPRPVTGSSLDIGAYEYIGTVGILNNDLKSGASIYPNPSTGLVLYKPEEFDQEDSFDFVVFSLSGEIVYSLLQNCCSRPEIDLSFLPRGLYLAKIQSSTKCIICKFELL